MTTFIRRFVCAIVSCPFLMRYLRNNQLTHWNRCKMVTYHICRLILGCRFHWQLAGEVSSVLTVGCSGLTLQCHNQLMETVSMSVSLGYIGLWLVRLRKQVLWLAVIPAPHCMTTAAVSDRSEAESAESFLLLSSPGDHDALKRLYQNFNFHWEWVDTWQLRDWDMNEESLSFELRGPGTNLIIIMRKRIIAAIFRGSHSEPQILWALQTNFSK